MSNHTNPFNLNNKEKQNKKQKPISEITTPKSSNQNHRHKTNIKHESKTEHEQKSHVIIKTRKRRKSVQLQVTGFEGAEGKDQMVFLNSGEVKNVFMGSLAGPESPKPWSHRTKLRAMESGGVPEDEGRGWESSMNKSVRVKVIVRRAIGFVISTTFILDRPWSSVSIQYNSSSSLH